MLNANDWNDLKYFLAVARAGSLTAAARVMDVNPSTVARRITVLETTLGERLFERRPDGYPLTDAGKRLLAPAQRIENEVAGLDRFVTDRGHNVAGAVTLTAAEPVIANFVLPSLPAFHKKYPDLRIELISDYRNLSHSRREVDVAIRTAQPSEGGLLARRIAIMEFGLYASESYIKNAGLPMELAALAHHSLIDWRDEFSKAPPAMWFRGVTLGNPPILKVNGVRDRTLAVQLGLGIALLPYLTARETQLLHVLRDVTIPPLDVWLMADPETARISRVRKLIEYLAERALQERDRFCIPKEGSAAPT